MNTFASFEIVEAALSISTEQNTSVVSEEQQGSYIIISKCFIPSLSSSSLVNIIYLIMSTNLVGGSTAGSDSKGKGYLSIYLSMSDTPDHDTQVRFSEPDFLLPSSFYRRHEREGVWELASSRWREILICASIS